MMTTHNGLTVYKPINVGFGRVGWECYRMDCTKIATGLAKSHSGAHYRACADHEGVCHEACWPM